MVSPAAGELVLIMGLPAAGKSTLAQSLVQRGYTRLNRDETGGSLSALASRLGGMVASGNTRLVADNTYVTRQARAPILDAAGRLGLRVRGLLAHDRASKTRKPTPSRGWCRATDGSSSPTKSGRCRTRDPGVFAPGVLFRYQRELEPPDASEGFAEIDHVPIRATGDPAWSNRAVIIWADGVLRRSRDGHRTPRSADDLDVPAEAAAVLGRFSQDGRRSSRSAGDRRSPKAR